MPTTFLYAKAAIPAIPGSLAQGSLVRKLRFLTIYMFSALRELVTFQMTFAITFKITFEITFKTTFNVVCRWKLRDFVRDFLAFDPEQIVYFTIGK